MRFTMKKSFYLFAISICFIFSFTSCNPNITDGEYRRAPNVEYNDAENITISVPKINSDTKYITIYRFNATNEEPSNKSEGVPIGMINTKTYTEDSYTFSDSYANNERSYCYRLKYYISDDNISYTNWSEKISITNTKKTQTYGLDYDLTYEKISLSYDEVANTLTLDSIPAFTSSASSDITDLFEKTPYIAIECSDGNKKIDSKLMPFPVSGDKSLNIQNFIPENFLPYQIKILGFVSVKHTQVTTDKNKKEIIRQYTFTEPSEVTGNTILKISAYSENDGIPY